MLCDSVRHFKPVVFSGKLGVGHDTFDHRMLEMEHGFKDQMAKDNQMLRADIQVLKADNQQLKDAVQDLKAGEPWRLLTQAIAWLF